MNRSITATLRIPQCDDNGLTKVFICDTPLSRLRGVFFRPGFSTSQAIYLRGCSSVHGIGLRFPLDAVFLDQNRRVLAVKRLRPFAACWHAGAADVLEIRAGRAEKLGIKPGYRINFDCLDAVKPFTRRQKSAPKIVRQRGASSVEFLIVAPILLYLGLGIVQLGFAYNARNVLNYASFEAARSGAVNNADVDTMRNELAYRLAPLTHGDGSNTAIANAFLQTSAATLDPLRTQIKIINPTTAAFTDFGVSDAESGQVVLPNSHLRHRSSDLGARSGLSIQDANLLKIEVVHGYELRFPWMDVTLPGVNFVLRELMTRADPANAVFYARGQLPLSSVATVRMQSEAWASHVESANVEPVASRPDTELLDSNLPQHSDSDATNASADSSDTCVGPHGLPMGLTMDSITDQGDIAQCSVASVPNPGHVQQATPTQSEQVVNSTEC